MPSIIRYLDGNPAVRVMNVSNDTRVIVLLGVLRPLSPVPKQVARLSCRDVVPRTQDALLAGRRG